MKQEKNNSSLQQREFELTREIKNDEYIETNKKEKNKSLREMFEEEIDNYNQQEDQRVV